MSHLFPHHKCVHFLGLTGNILNPLASQFWVLAKLFKLDWITGPWESTAPVPRAQRLWNSGPNKKCNITTSLFYCLFVWFSWESISVGFAVGRCLYFLSLWLKGWCSQVAPGGGDRKRSECRCVCVCACIRVSVCCGALGTTGCDVRGSMKVCNSRLKIIFLVLEFTV